MGPDKFVSSILAGSIPVKIHKDLPISHGGFPYGRDGQEDHPRGLVFQPMMRIAYSTWDDHPLATFDHLQPLVHQEISGI